MPPFNPFPPQLYQQSALALPPEERDIDLDNMMVSSFINYDNEFLITLRGEPTRGGDEYGDEQHVMTVSFGMSFVNPEKHEQALGLSAAVAVILDTWQRNNVPLQLATASEGTSVWGILAETPTLFLPVPAP